MITFITSKDKAYSLTTKSTPNKYFFFCFLNINKLKGYSSETLCIKVSLKQCIIPIPDQAASSYRLSIVIITFDLGNLLCCK